MPAKRYKISHESPVGAERARALQEEAEARPNNPEKDPAPPQAEAAEPTPYASGQEVAFSDGTKGEVVREIGELCVISVEDAEGNKHERMVSKDMLARTEIRGQLEEEVMDYLDAASELELIPADQTDAVLEHASVLIEELTTGKPDELNVAKLSERIQKTIQASVDGGGAADFAPVWSVLQETAEDRKEVIKQELAEGYELEDVLDLAEGLGASTQEVMEAILEGDNEATVDAVASTIEHAGDVIAQLEEDQAEAETPEALAAPVRQKEAVLPVLDLAALAMSQIDSGFARKLREATQRRREAPPTVLPPAKGEMSGEEIIDLVAKMAKDFLFGKSTEEEKKKKPDAASSAEASSTEAAPDSAPDTSVESKETRDPRSSELYRAFSAKYELQTTAEDRDALVAELNLIAEETESPSILAVLADIDSRKLSSMADLLDDLAAVKEKIRARGAEVPGEAEPSVESQEAPVEVEAGPEDGEESPEEAEAKEATEEPPDAAEAEAEKPVMPEPSEASGPSIKEVDLVEGKAHMDNVLRIQSALQEEIARYPQGYEGTNVAKLADLKYEDYNDLAWTLKDQKDRSPGPRKLWRAMNPFSGVNRAKREIKKWDHMIDEANEQITEKAGYTPIASEIAGIDPDVTKQYL